MQTLQLLDRFEGIPSCQKTELSSTWVSSSEQLLECWIGTSVGFVQLELEVELAIEERAVHHLQPLLVLAAQCDPPLGDPSHQLGVGGAEVLGAWRVSLSVTEHGRDVPRDAGVAVWLVRSPEQQRNELGARLGSVEDRFVEQMQ